MRLQFYSIEAFSTNCSCSVTPQITNISLISTTLSICNFPLVPSWILAVFIGLCFGLKFYGLGSHVTGSLSYCITYVMYALMISSGLVVHCLFLNECTSQPQHNTKYYKDACKIDASLTTCIATSFAFSGLIDIKLIPERSYVTMMTLLSFFGFIFYTYFAELDHGLNLYFTSILIGCSVYMLTQLIQCIIKWPGWFEFGFLLGGGLVGGTSLLIVRTEYCWLCHFLGPWSVEGIWYYGSDIAMLLLGVYIWKSRSDTSGLETNKT